MTNNLHLLIQWEEWSRVSKRRISFFSRACLEIYWVTFGKYQTYRLTEPTLNPYRLFLIGIKKWDLYILTYDLEVLTLKPIQAFK